MTLHRIEQFCPPGMQIESPGGLSFKLEDVVAIEASTNGGYHTMVIRYRGGTSTTLTFYRNVDGGPADVYGLKRNIEGAVEQARKPDLYAEGGKLYQAGRAARDCIHGRDLNMQCLAGWLDAMLADRRAVERTVVRNMEVTDADGRV